MKVFRTKPIHPKIKLQHHNSFFPKKKKKKMKNFVFWVYFYLSEKDSVKGSNPR